LCGGEVTVRKILSTKFVRLYILFGSRDFAGMVNHSHEFVIKAEIRIINTSKILKGALLFSSRLSTCSEMYKREKLDI
jgi:hypothetical protein